MTKRSTLRWASYLRWWRAEGTGPTLAVALSPFQMAVWWQALILHCCLLMCAVLPAPVPQRNKYTVSFSLTRSTRTQVQQLNRKYVSAVCARPPAHLAQLQVNGEGLYILCVLSRQKEQQFGDVHFEDRSKELKELPLLSTDLESWLNLTVSAWLIARKQCIISMLYYDYILYFFCTAFHKTHRFSLLLKKMHCWFRFFSQVMEQHFFPLFEIQERHMFLLENTSIPSFVYPLRVVLKRVWLLWSLWIQEQERLNAAMTDMQTFWNMLERKRQQLELEGEHSTGPVGHVSLPESIALIQLELRDLMSQVSSQVASTFTATILTRFA